MASITITIPDAQVPRLVTALKRVLIEGDAVDLQNPTNEEIRLKLKNMCITYIKKEVENTEIQINRETFTPNDLDVS